ncbi:hypothetical protein HMI54_005775, partial [Coelomomyces lativittatus]
MNIAHGLSLFPQLQEEKFIDEVIFSQSRVYSATSSDTEKVQLKVTRPAFRFKFSKNSKVKTASCTVYGNIGNLNVEKATRYFQNLVHFTTNDQNKRLYLIFSQEDTDLTDLRVFSNKEITLSIRCNLHYADSISKKFMTFKMKIDTI